MDALEYGQTCLNASTDNECQYLTQETCCRGSVPFKCQCPIGKYFNKEKGHYKCENLLEINETCSQTDSCKNGNCIGMPAKCLCLPFQYFDQITGQCLNQINVDASLTTITKSSTSSSSALTSTTTTSSRTTSSTTVTSTTTTSSRTTSSTTVTSTTTTSKNRFLSKIELLFVFTYH